MPLNFEDFINASEHIKQIKRSAQKIKNNSIQFNNSSQYLHDLFDFCKEDVKHVATCIYDSLLHNKNAYKLKFKTAELEDCINKGTQNFLSTYESIIAGYNAGGFFRDYSDSEKDITAFKKETTQLCQNQSEHFSTKYRSSKIKKLYNFLIFIFSATAALTSVIGLIIMVIK